MLAPSVALSHTCKTGAGTDDLAVEVPSWRFCFISGWCYQERWNAAFFCQCDQFRKLLCAEPLLEVVRPR